MTTTNLLVTGLLADHVSESIFVALVGGIVLLRMRRYRAVGAAAVGAASSAATVFMAVIGVLVGLVALGYWDPPISEMVGDVLAFGGTLYDLVGEWIVRQTIGRLEDVAA